ncbi:helix-turn-helix domain-containing protein [Natronobacterium gregoryi]|uniref:Transcriptional regulator n=2 Tax=Natronobacterium gregoryi TaxID=44930 RepID=L0AL60_NATGS|nr:helix-turn-helix domain-containing protein [Natronobacterium gregoryi]AFZ74174.1 putative transcriptional regulator [Natronobacterium gregoryi SP2]ELY63630.1 TrmB family transcriptional regulator [Natronobacterium gregoryi SP2]PLK22032.1 transcriptional regulator [Natronobacterium gregoryi SP2]SFI50869.1 Predicted transcriptional regulator [Natronobacterium gregoryi]
MDDSMAEQLQQEMTCDGLLECIHGLKRLDRECFHAVVESEEPSTIDEVAERVDRERSTVYRSIQRLLQRGVVQKTQVNYEEGGYYHVYYPTDPSRITSDMRRRLNDWYAKMSHLIREFEDEHGDTTETVERR